MKYWKHIGLTRTIGTPITSETKKTTTKEPAMKHGLMSPYLLSHALNKSWQLRRLANIWQNPVATLQDNLIPKLCVCLWPRAAAEYICPRSLSRTVQRAPKYRPRCRTVPVPYRTLLTYGRWVFRHDPREDDVLVLFSVRYGTVRYDTRASCTVWYGTDRYGRGPFQNDP